MIVCFQVAVETIPSTAKVYLADFTQRRQDVQVPVYRTQRKPGILGSELRVNLLRRGMRLETADEVRDGVTLYRAMIASARRLTS